MIFNVVKQPVRAKYADEFPSLHRAIASGALDDEDDPDLEYRFGLARILDGIAQLISRA